MNEIYLAVAQQLQKEVPELAYIDLDTGQIDNVEMAPPVEFPAALIDIRIPVCEDESTRVQICTVNISVRLVFEAWYDETANISPDKWKRRALEKMEVIDKVYKALQGWETDFLSALSRTSVEPERRSDGLKVYTLTFASTQLDDADL